MAKVWSADGLMAMSPEERQALFDTRNSEEITDVPNALLERTRAKIRAHIAESESAPSET